MENIKEINIKNSTYYFFDDMINIKNFNANFKLIKNRQKSYKSIDIYHIGYITMKVSRYVNIHSVNPLYLIVNKVDGFIEEKEENKCLNCASTDNNKEVLKKYTELWDEIKNSIEEIDNKTGEYGKDYMEIKFNSDVNLPLNKPLKFYNITIIVRSIFQESNKYYPQIYLDESLHKLQKCCNMRELMFLKELTLITQIKQNNVWFGHYW